MRPICLIPWVLFASALAFGARAITVDDQDIEGELLALDPTPTVTLRVGDKAQQISCADLRQLELRPGNPEAAPEAVAIVLRSGDRLLGTIQGGSGRAVTWRSPVFGSAECPLQAIARIELSPAQPGQGVQPGDKLDRLLFRNGETVEGAVETLSQEGIRFRSALLGQLEIGYDRLTTLVFAGQGGAAPEMPKGILAILHGADGTVVSGHLKGLKDGNLELQSHFGATLSPHLDGILRMDFRGGRLVYLSDLEPAEVKETPFFDLVWHYRRDLSVDGNPLRLGDLTYRKGLGVHSRCELTYALDGAYRRFLADAGIDEEVGEKGHVDVVVLVDGKPRFERKGLTGRDPALPVAIEVAGASRLTLVVDFGEEFDICDHLDWANARLIR